MKLKALVVGLGQIGMGYDYEKGPKHFILTHSQAFNSHTDYELVGGVDLDNEKLALFEAKFRKSAYSSISHAMADTQPDVVAIATPTEQHVQDFKMVLDHGMPRLILCEKPLAHNRQKADEMLRKAERGKCQVAVNYIRRFEPGSIRLGRKISRGELGFPIKGCVWYSKGLYNNGSHFINLLEQWLGPVKNSAVLKKGHYWAGSDPEPDVSLEFEKGTIYMLAACEENFSYYEMELIGRLGKIHYSRRGRDIRLWKTVADPVYQGYTILSDESEEIPTDFDRYQWHVVQNLSDYLNKGHVLYSDGNSALQTVITLENVCRINS